MERYGRSRHKIIVSVALTPYKRNVCIVLFPIRPILRFQYCAGLMHLNSVPGSLRYLDAIEFLTGTEAEARHLLEAALVSCRLPIVNRPTRIQVRQFFVEHLIQTALQADDCLRCLQMTMNGDMSPHFKCIQHPLRCIFRRRSQVEVHTPAFILPCFPV